MVPNLLDSRFLSKPPRPLGLLLTIGSARDITQEFKSRTSFHYFLLSNNSDIVLCLGASATNRAWIVKSYKWLIRARENCHHHRGKSKTQKHWKDNLFRNISGFLGSFVWHIWSSNFDESIDISSSLWQSYTNYMPNIKSTSLFLIQCY